MAKLITSMRIRADRAEKLRDKTIDLIIETKEKVSEADIVNFLIDEFLDRVKIDKDGLFADEEGD